MTILETLGLSDPLKNQGYARAIYNLAYKYLPHFYGNTEGLVKEWSQTKTIRLIFEICDHPTQIGKDLNPPKKLVEMIKSSTHRFSDSSHAVIIAWPPFGAIGYTLAPFFSALNYDPKSYSETQLYHLGPSPQGGTTLRYSFPNKGSSCKHGNCGAGCEPNEQEFIKFLASEDNLKAPIMAVNQPI